MPGFQQGVDDLKAKLVQLRREGEERAAERLAAQLNIPYADLSKMPISLEAVRVISEEKARNAKAASIEVKPKKVAVAATNPELPATKALIKELHDEQYETKLFVVSPSSLDVAWRLYQFIKPTAASVTGKVSITQGRIDELKTRLMSFEAIKKEFGGPGFREGLAGDNDRDHARGRASRCGRRTSTPKPERKKRRSASAWTGCCTTCLMTCRSARTRRSFRASSFCRG